jgi:hypothetical protein
MSLFITVEPGGKTYRVTGFDDLGALDAALTNLVGSPRTLKVEITAGEYPSTGAGVLHLNGATVQSVAAYELPG